MNKTEKSRRKQIKLNMKFGLYKKEHPNECYCNFNLSSQGTPLRLFIEEKDSIRYETRNVLSYPFLEKTNQLYQHPVYRCHNCNKEYEIDIPMA